MIDEFAITQLIQGTMPDADVHAVDYSGTLDHYNIRIRSSAFAGKSILAQHQLVYAALRPALDDGRLHAVQLQTLTPEGTIA